MNFHLAKIHAASVIFDYVPVPCDNARKTGGTRRCAGEIVRKNLFHLHECTPAALVSPFIPAIVRSAIIVPYNNNCIASRITVFRLFVEFAASPPAPIRYLIDCPGITQPVEGANVFGEKIHTYIHMYICIYGPIAEKFADFFPFTSSYLRAFL